MWRHVDAVLLCVVIFSPRFLLIAPLILLHFWIIRVTTCLVSVEVCCILSLRLLYSYKCQDDELQCVHRLFSFTLSLLNFNVFFPESHTLTDVTNPIEKQSTS
jgi:hypothetical protein